MRGKKQIAAVVLAVIFAVTAGMPHSTVYAEPDSTGKYTANSNKHPAAKAASSSVAPWHSNPPGKVSRRAKGPFSYSRENTPHRATTRKGTAVK